ncbi:MAG: pyruvate kinase [Candidatus Cloacimonadota bacterium]|nr:pyruvate kinase [Candidatus Cloacimonadota bacterium]
MKTRSHLCKIVCTIGPATDTLQKMEALIEAGMDIARLNYSHGDFEYHAHNIKKLRQAAINCGRQLSIMADLPGPKMRIGKLREEIIYLKPEDNLILTTEPVLGDYNRISVTFPSLPQVVKPQDIIFLSDGMIQLQVDRVGGSEIYCKIRVGGELRSNKGLNLSGVDLGISAFTEHDRECLASALGNQVDAVSQSFVCKAEDLISMRQAAQEMGYDPFVIAKIERAEAVKRIDEIIQVSDGIMIARGDLGVETRIERIALVQKQIMARASHFGKPVIIATQLLESMTRNPLPTRAEATDVANAILDGTDCLMLSEESAIGRYPNLAVEMLAKIASCVEENRALDAQVESPQDFFREDATHITKLISYNVSFSVHRLKPKLVVANTETGYTARMISRFLIPVWIVARCSKHRVCQGLQFSYGVYPVLMPEEPEDSDSFVTKLMQEFEIPDGRVILVEGPSADDIHANHKIEILCFPRS